MKKIVPFFQKSIGMITVIVFALLFVYALGMATPTAEIVYVNEYEKFYDAIEPFNNGLIWVSIIGALLGGFYFILRNHVRTIYYVSNFVYFGLLIAYLFFAGIFTILGVHNYDVAYHSMPLDEINANFVAMHQNRFLNPKTPVFGLGIAAGVLVLLILVPVCILLVDKIQHRIRYERNKKNGIENPVTYDPKAVEMKEATENGNE